MLGDVDGDRRFCMRLGVRRIDICDGIYDRVCVVELKKEVG